MIDALDSAHVTPLSSAIAIANTAHYGAVDEFDEPAILRPLRMMLGMATREGQIVALLHDAIGRPAADPWTIDRLRTYFPSDVILDALDALTWRTDQFEPYLYFIRRVRMDSLATVVMVRRLRDDLARNPEAAVRDRMIGALAILGVDTL